MKMYIICPICNKRTLVNISEEDYNRINNGELIQRIFPNAETSYRELLVSGTCYECQEKIFTEAV